MSVSSKSPASIVRESVQIALEALPLYSHSKSPRRYTQPQLFGCLVLKTFLGLDYRGTEQFLRDSPDLRKELRLKGIPHYTTLQKACWRMMQQKEVSQLLQTTVRRYVVKKKSAPLEASDRLHFKLTAIDSTGFQSHHVSEYFAYRRGTIRGEIGKVWRRRYPKLWTLVDCESHLILSLHTGRGPGSDLEGFVPTLVACHPFVSFDVLLADAGFDCEASHEIVHKLFDAKALIPPTRTPKRNPVKAKKPFRQKMARLFRDGSPKQYRSRWQVETVVSMLKRNLGQALSARGYASQSIEMMLLSITHNIQIIFYISIFSTEHTGGSLVSV